MRTLILASLLLLAFPATASAARTIRTADTFVKRIGSFRPAVNPTIAAAERAFGPAGSKQAVGATACRVEWRQLRLRIVFANFGAPGRGPCARGIGLAQSFIVRGESFRTTKGLRVGQRSRSIRVRHPDAEFRKSAWWLKTAVSPIGDNSEFPVLRALVSKGRVTAIDGWIGAAGD